MVKESTAQGHANHLAMIKIRKRAAAEFGQNTNSSLNLGQTVPSEFCRDFANAEQGCGVWLHPAKPVRDVVMD